MKGKIFIVGETTYDIIFKDNKPIDAKCGGSQFNTAISLGRLGLPVEFISAIGNDKVGEISLDFLQKNKVGTNYIERYNDNSRIALAFLDENNNADYSFFSPNLQPDAFSFPNASEGDIILFGSSFAIKQRNRPQLIDFLNRSKENGALIIYDPNFRKSNIQKLNQLKPVLIENFKLSSIVKGSDEDFEFIFGSNDSHQTYCILAEYFAQNLLYTSGSSSVKLHTLNYVDEYPVPQIQPVSTIGAGDNFNAGIIYALYKQHITTQNLDEMTREQWDVVLDYAIRFAQNVCMRYDNYIDEDFASTIVY